MIGGNNQDESSWPFATKPGKDIKEYQLCYNMIWLMYDKINKKLACCILVLKLIGTT